MATGKKTEHHDIAHKAISEHPETKISREARFADLQKKMISLTWDIGGPLCTAEGIELVHVEFQREPGGRVLRAYIDRPGGVSLDDCSGISRQLSDILDIKMDTDLPYTLEVSSPGLDRPISKKEDFNRFAGETARIRTAQPINGQKNFKGTLVGMFDDCVHLQLEKETVVILYEDIMKARLVNYNGE